MSRCSTGSGLSTSESRSDLLTAVESCQRLLDAQRTDLATLRSHVQIIATLRLLSLCANLKKTSEAIGSLIP
ncbi:hypothetical protein PF005_g5603 [Phytophthora fragariae]|uniref:Uncharacterized protein n=1 Tax=Phytophthora fragariae TaxID=53985 RepID=A0A6A3K0E3_9STRA|nr:hypothetical protein PF003_g30693 [Phytophthora fragariae]KAE8933888.1 hypothetical protein PF009_g16120 [Phytophthora fragariae]KAE9001010.1 hypothetical protein PF011_g13930 [Phytophthora fragariae]KAE9080915.1 hypothetical protein PF010_g22204 [Phytophthora fragariae]KAE9126234.1 hypothetical protein PF007_g6079 [Phytophthora fragariae]